MEKSSERIFSLQFILVLLLSVISGSSSYMVNPILPEYLVSRGAPLEITGLISSLMSWVALVGRPFCGAAADRYNKKVLMIISYLLTILCLVLYSVSDTVPMLVFVRILNGVAFSISGTVSMAFGAEFIPLSRMGEGMSYIAIGTVISTMLGPQLGDLVQQLFGLEKVFLYASLLNLTCIVLTIVLPYKHQKEEKEKFVFRLSDFFAYQLWMYVILIGVLSVGNGILLYYLKDFGDSRAIDNIALFYTVGSIATMGSKPFTGKLIDRKGIAFVLYPSFVISAIFAAVFAKSYTLIVVLIASVLKSIGQGTGSAAIQTEAVKQLGIKKSGVASSTCYIGQDLGNALGPAIGAVIISKSGYEPLFMGYAVLLLACIPIYYFYNKLTANKQ